MVSGKSVMFWGRYLISFFKDIWLYWLIVVLLKWILFKVIGYSFVMVCVMVDLLDFELLIIFKVLSGFMLNVICWRVVVFLSGGIMVILIIDKCVLGFVSLCFLIGVGIFESRVDKDC